MKFRARWTWPWGPPFVVRIINLFLPFSNSPFLPLRLSLTDHAVGGVSCQVAAMLGIILSAYLPRYRVSPSPFSASPSFPTSLLFSQPMFYPGS